MSESSEKFSASLDAELESPVMLATEPSEFSELAVGGRFLDAIKRIFESIDVSGMTKEEFMAVVGKAFDSFVAPLLASTPFGLILTPMLKALVMGMASRFYDNHSQQTFA